MLDYIPFKSIKYQAMTKVLLITMGGTIDAAPYPEEDGAYPPDATMTGENRAALVLKNILNMARVSGEITVDTIQLCAKDSKEIDDQDREALRNLVSRASQDYDRIIVTMGTDRMCETAQDLLSKIPGLECPVVFTGAIWPLANGAKSDGWGNLQQAAFVNDNVANRVYIAMGELFAPAEQVEKDFQRRKFVRKV
jgi:L-asparaginase/Glu-tRNA(Gln) amidotransferase subunit D